MIRPRTYAAFALGVIHIDSLPARGLNHRVGLLSNPLLKEEPVDLPGDCALGLEMPDQRLAAASSIA